MMFGKPYKLSLTADDVYVYSRRIYANKFDMLLLKDLMTSKYRQFYIADIRSIEHVFFAIISLLNKNRDAILKELKYSENFEKYFDALNPGAYKAPQPLDIVISAEQVQSITIDQSKRVELNSSCNFITLRNLKDGRNKLSRSGIHLSIYLCLKLLSYIVRTYNFAGFESKDIKQ